jgi:hypothetical protein
MLPILRIIPVGGVFLAIAILVLSLGAPGGSRIAMAPMMSARGPLLQIDEHPEWRQFLIRAALQRADELNHLRDLPDEPVRSAPDEAKVAGLPIERSDADPEDITGTINEAPAATIPIDIGETSSTELPAIRPDDGPPVVKTPDRLKSQNVNRRKVARRFHRTKPAKPEPPALNFFEALFGVSPARPASTATPQTNQPATGRLVTSQR